MGEPAWRLAGKTPGVQVWRIEQFLVKEWPDEQYGQFHTGDSYMVLHTQQNEKRRSFEWHIFFWLGDETSVDEQTVAAYKTVELCDMLDGRPTQSRETQNNESTHFRSLFPKLRYLAGGVPTGLRHVVTGVYAAKLFQIRKTKKGVVEREVDCARQALNDGDCFLLDAGQTIYIWHGPKAHPLEKYEANAAGERLESRRVGKVTSTTVIDDEFWRLLGGKGAIKSAEEATDEIQEVDRGEGILFKVTDADGQMKCFEVARKDLRSNMLDTNDVMMLDHGDEICIWIGMGASQAEARSGFQIALDYLKTNRMSSKTPIHMYREGQDIKNRVWNEVFAD